MPSQFEEVFKKSEGVVSEYFSKSEFNPEKGTIEIGGDRYILVRAKSMSVEFFKIIAELYKDQGDKRSWEIASSFLFDIGHAIGRSDAENFSGKMGLEDPVAKLSAGPVHFAHSGWASVNIKPESSPSPDEDFFLVYDHEASFESDAWVQSGTKSSHPVCIMNCGYSSGWCEVSFGVPLVAVELSCRAMGHDKDHFIMAPPGRIESRLKDYVDEFGERRSLDNSGEFGIPGFFDRKAREEEITQKNELLSRMNSHMIDRETKMIELKKKIEDLERQLKEAGK